MSSILQVFILRKKKKEETPPAARHGWCRPGAGGPPETQAMGFERVEDQERVGETMEETVGGNTFGDD